MNRLPRGWSSATLGDIAVTLRNGLFASRPFDDPPGTSVLRISAVRRGLVNFSDAKYVRDLTDGEKSRFQVREGDLLFARYNGSRHLVGICGRVGPHDHDVVHPDKLIRVVVDPKVADSRFICHQMAASTTRGFLEPRIRTTAGQSGISGRDLRLVPVVFPPLDQQCRIVEVLEDHLSRLDAAEAELHRARNRRPLLQESFLLKHRGIRDADHRRLGELLSELLVNGRSVPDGDGFPVLRLTCLRDGRVDLTQRKLGSWSASEAAAHLVTKGDLLVSRGNGSLRLVGRAALVDVAPLEPIAFPDTLIRVRARPEIMSNAFLCLIWNGVAVRRQIEGLARTTAGIYKINQKHLQEVTLPCPDITTQAALVAEATSLLDSSSRIEASLDMALVRGKRLRRALLTAAFAGRLTGRTEDDEVVEELANV